ncbi:hypothetical protein V2G26_012706 [Clonostachys chloroleuca]
MEALSSARSRDAEVVGPCAGNGLKGSNSSIPFGSAVKKDVPSCIEELRMARNGKVLVVSRGGTLQNSFRLRTDTGG